MVVWYHIWPHSLPGGFVGVDVFFVISGYLIVGSLAREAMSTGTLKLAKFYSRRIQSPAARCVGGTSRDRGRNRAAVPAGPLAGRRRDVAASALNIQNWNQAFSTSSYEGATASVSPLQHFWSLAVEEQFYLVIPAADPDLCRGFPGLEARAEDPALAVLGTAALLPLLHSVLFSACQPGPCVLLHHHADLGAGAGGILAVALPQLRTGSTLAVPLGWLGLAMVLSSAVLFSTAMDFPGYAALLPVARNHGPARWPAVRVARAWVRFVPPDGSLCLR